MEQQRPIRVQVPGHGIIEFPAGTTEEQMKAAMLKLPSVAATAPEVEPQPRERGALERFFGFFGLEPNEKAAQYRDVFERGGSIEEVLRMAADDEAAQRGGGVFRKDDREALPYVGGTIGGMLGGAPGAALGGAAGESFRQLDNRMAGQAAPSTATDAARGVVAQGVVQGAIEGAGTLIPKAAGKAAHAVYRGYLKPSLAAAERGKAKEIVKTALEESLPISDKGTKRASELIHQINQQVNKELANAGGFVDLVKIANRVRTWARTRYNKPGAPAVDYDAALRVADEIDKHASLGLPPGANPSSVRVSAEKANDTKQALDRAIGDTGFGAERNAAKEARKVGRHAARTAIEDVVPAVKPMNAREAKIIDALESLEGAVGRLGNTDKLMGVRTMGAGLFGAGAVTAGQDPVNAAVNALVLRGLVSPAVASTIAIKANKFAKVPGTSPAFAVRMATILMLRESEHDR